MQLNNRKSDSNAWAAPGRVRELDKQAEHRKTLRIQARAVKDFTGRYERGTAAPRRSRRAEELLGRSIGSEGPRANSIASGGGACGDAM